MGANFYTITLDTDDFKNDIRELVADNRAEYGSNYYNGNIAGTSIGRIVRIADKWTKTVENKFYKKIENDEDVYFRKGTTVPCQLGVIGYQGYSAKVVEAKEVAPRKKGVRLLNSYTVTTKTSSGREYTLKSFPTVTEAKKYIKELVENDSILNYVNLEIKRLRENSTPIRTHRVEFVTEGKLAKTKRKAKTKFYKPVNRYVLCVGAAM